jgi:hypothetical protein
LWPPITLVADQPVKNLKVTVTQFAYRGDPNITKNLRQLDKDSVAVSPDLNHIFPFRSPVYVSGQFIGFRDATLSPKFHLTIAAYNPNSVPWEGDRSGYIQVPVQNQGDFSWRRSTERTAKKMDSAFTPNPNLAPDAVELSASEQPDNSDYFPTRPKLRPANIPGDFIAVRVFHRGKFIGWSWLPKEGVAQLHKPKKT